MAYGSFFFLRDRPIKFPPPTSNKRVRNKSVKWLRTDIYILMVLQHQQGSCKSPRIIAYPLFQGLSLVEVEHSCFKFFLIDQVVAVRASTSTSTTPFPVSQKMKIFFPVEAREAPVAFESVSQLLWSILVTIISVAIFVWVTGMTRTHGAPSTRAG